MAGAPIELLQRVPLFEGLDRGELEQVARLFKERRFSQGETVVMEGSGGAAFFVIASGEAKVAVGAAERPAMQAGDYFGEIALIDQGSRSATVTAASDLLCYGLTFWEFRPLVEGSGVIAWKLLESLAKKLRSAQAD